MTPQPVLIYGQRCVLAKTGGGALTNYVVTGPAGTTLTQQASRFLAVARAAEAIRNQGTTK